MPGLTPEQIEARRHSIGASDVATILGVNPWGKVGDLWLEKTGGVDLADVRKETKATQWGKILEDPILDMAEVELGYALPDRQVEFRLDSLHLVAHLDAWDSAALRPVEAKSSGLDGHGNLWGEEGTDEVPEHVLIQVHAQMMATGSSEALVVALLGGFGGIRIGFFPVKRNDGLVKVITEACIRFWQAVESGVCPPDGDFSAPYLQARKRETGWMRTDLPVELIDDLQIWEQHYKSAEQERDRAKAKAIIALGGAEGATFGDGRALTYYPDKRGRRSLRGKPFGI